MDNRIFSILFMFFLLAGVSCSSSGETKGKALYESQCASCHLAPDIQDLPKNLWKDKVLPDMGARMGIRDPTYDPYKGYSFEEQYAMIQSGIYGVTPSISIEEWKQLVDYVLSNAPDSLRHIKKVVTIKNLSQFSPRTVNIDSTEGSFTTFTEFDAKKSKVVTADIRGRIFEYDVIRKELDQRFTLGNAITAFSETDSTPYITTVGILDPSEISAGRIQVLRHGTDRQLPFEFHRPVHTLVHDFNKNGKEEIVVCEFGNLTGQLSLLVEKNDSTFEKKA